MNMLHQVTAGLIWALIGCSASVSGMPLRIETAGFQFAPIWGCAGFGIPSFRVDRDGDALRFVDAGTGDEVKLVWPFGFVATLQDGKAVLYASDGVVVGREGDVLDDIGSCGSADGTIRVDSVGARSYR